MVLLMDGWICISRIMGAPAIGECRREVFILCDKDCINCQKEYCTNVYRESSRYCNRSEEAKQYQREYQKKKRQEAKGKGLCIICRKKKANHGSKCLECYLRQKRHDRAKYDGKRQHWMENGLCYMCGEQVIKGKHLCQKHYQIAKNNAIYLNSHENTIEARKKVKHEMQILWSRS